MSRRRPTLRRMLAAGLVATTLTSVLVLGTYEYVESRSLLTSAVERQLEDHQRGQARAIRDGLGRLGDAVAVIARNQGTVEALTAFAGAYRELEESAPALTTDEQETLAELYGDAGSPPSNAAGRYLQYQYVVANPYPPDRRDELVRAARDTTTYGRVHAAVHADLRDLTTQLGFGDLLLIDAASGVVVYSTAKRLDLGAELMTGALRDTALADAVTRRLPRTTVGEIVLADVDPYPPSDSRPVMFAVASLRDGAEVVGTVAAEIPVEALNRLTTADGRWRAVGLGESGETYVVGSDRLMRSDSRLWLEDPEAYLQAIEQDGQGVLAGSIRAAGTTVLQQPVLTAAVEEALDGRRYVGRSENYVGQDTLTVAGPVDVAGLDWVLVADLRTSEADRALTSLTRSLALAVAVLVPMVVLIGTFLAARIARPVQPIVAAASAVADGKLDTTVEDLGRNELGDVGRRLNRLTAQLRQQAAARDREEREIIQLLASVLPTRLVERLRHGSVKVTDLTDTATIVAVTVDGLLDRPDLDEDTVLDLVARLSRELEATASSSGLERVRSSSEHHIFAAGLGVRDTGAAAAATFVWELAGVLASLAEDAGITVGHHAGLASGEVVTGALSAEHLTYGVFGEPVRRALVLDGVASPGQVLLDASVVRELGDEWVSEPVSGLVDLQGFGIDAQRLQGPTRHPPAPAVVEETRQT